MNKRMRLMPLLSTTSRSGSALTGNRHASPQAGRATRSVMPVAAPAPAAKRPLALIPP
jgi:hypothetical protein